MKCNLWYEFFISNVKEQDMKRFIQGNWKQIKEKLKAKYDKLTERDLNYRDGAEEELLRRLQSKLNMEKRELISELKRVITQSK